MQWLFLALLCAFSLATADAATKKSLADYTVRELVIVRFGFSGLMLAPLLLVYPPPALPMPLWGWLAGLMPLEILAMLLYMRAIRDSPLALTLPYLAFTPLFTTITGWLLLDERVSLQALCGILLVVVGAYLLNLNQVLTGSRRAWLDPFKAIYQERGSRLMLGVAVLYSVTSVMGKGALQYVPPSFFGAFYFCLLGIATLAIFSATEPQIIRVMWRRPLQHLFIGCAMAVMIITHFLAVQMVEVASMIAVKRTSLLFGMVYGAILFSEKSFGLHFFAGALMVAGVMLIAT